MFGMGGVRLVDRAIVVPGCNMASEGQIPECDTEKLLALSRIVHLPGRTNAGFRFTPVQLRRGHTERSQNEILNVPKMKY